MGGPPAVEADCAVLFGGRLRIRQPRRGYRFSIDAVLLAHWARPPSGAGILELGTGCGVIPLILCLRHPRVEVWAVEIQPELAALARRNIADNGFEEKIRVVEADLRRLPEGRLPRLFDLVIANPPFHSGGSGRVNPERQRALARHEISMRLEDLLAAGRRRLRTGGRMALIYAPARAVDLLAGMRNAGIEPKRLRAVHAKPGAGARQILVEGVRAGRPGMVVEPPLAVYEAPGRYTPEVQAMLGGRWTPQGAVDH